MLKKILQLNGVQKLNKEQKSKLSGGGRDPKPPQTEGDCRDEEFIYFKPCGELCNDNTSIPGGCPPPV